MFTSSLSLNSNVLEKKKWGRREGSVSGFSANRAVNRHTGRSTRQHALHELVDLLVFSPLLRRQEHYLGFGHIELARAQEPV